MYRFDLSKLAFIFLVFTIITGGASINLLPCQMQYELQNSIILKHFISFILIFGLLMMEGGWEFNINVNDNTNYNWANGNTLHTLGWAAILYVFFVLSSKMKFNFSIILFISILSIYIINTYKNNLAEKKILNPEIKEIFNKILIILILVFVIIWCVGFVTYFLYKKAQYKKSFSIINFFVGVNNCRSLQ
jgi:hypothetical protein